MEFTRISVPITVDEREALRTLAHSMKRDPRQLARAILRNALGITEGEQENKQALSISLGNRTESATLTTN